MPDGYAERPDCPHCLRVLGRLWEYELLDGEVFVGRCPYSDCGKEINIKAKKVYFVWKWCES